MTHSLKDMSKSIMNSMVKKPYDVWLMPIILATLEAEVRRIMV
jgi:hypothetical protein